MSYRSRLKYGIFPAIITAVFILQGFSGKDQQFSRNIFNSLSPQDTIKKKVRWPGSFGLGRSAGQKYIDSLDIDVRPDGQGLPPGAGTVKQGQAIYLAKCLVCHTGKSSRGRASAAESPGPALITDSLSGARVKTIGNYWPYASTVYDYINRAMPYNAPGSLSPDEVYSLTAYLLYANKIIPADAVMNAKTLPRVKMPAEKMFVPDDRTGGAVIR
ncbi:cytochrome c [Daejeonella sp. JGW-45]|uniref:c-type cytochrome n=1 Tax=Daejeonella sp. JGW-45 TaxID=3034148 RepID=UPI0023EDCADF|nr:cytochrome c [Daejeonella sp. JGW-45]